MSTRKTLSVFAACAVLATPGLLIPGADHADQYRVTIYTSDAGNAGTDSNIRIKFYGKLGDVYKSTPEKVLDPRGNSFERAHWDTVVLNINNLGRLYAIKLFTDSSGKNPGWLPNTVYITNLNTGLRTDFGVDQWLGGKGNPSVLTLRPSNHSTYSKSQLEKEVIATGKAITRQTHRKKKSSYGWHDVLRDIKETADTINAVKDAVKPY